MIPVTLHFLAALFLLRLRHDRVAGAHSHRRDGVRHGRPHLCAAVDDSRDESSGPARNQEAHIRLGRVESALYISRD